MNYLCIQLLCLAACLWSVSSASYSTNNTELNRLRETKAELTTLYQKLQHIAKKLEPESKRLHVTGERNHTESTLRQKRQLAFGGGFGMGFGAYDYNDYYGEYVSDYAYDYYDWICSDTACQLCDILTSECCDPAIDVNCFLPDSCLNNPCLSGGTCITTRTLDNQPDFICVCLPGLTGKYCQLVNDYFVGAEIAFAPAVAAVGAGAIIPTSGVQNKQAAGAATAKTVATKQQAAKAVPTAAAKQPAKMVASAPAIAIKQPVQTAQAARQVQASRAPDPNAQLQEQRQEYQNLLARQQQQQSQSLGMMGNNGQMRMAPSRRKRCADGQVYNSEKLACVDFALSRRKK